MGQKVNPTGMRLGITQDWSSNWYAESKDFAKYLNEDLKIRQFLQKALAHASVTEIKIQRLASNLKVTVSSARPGLIIGKKGGDIDALKEKISKMLKVPIHLSVQEVRKPELQAKLVAESVVQQLERRVMFRRVMKRAVQNSMRQGALGIKVSVSGRLGGTEIARTEWYREGRVPLHTFRADISYHVAVAQTTYGVIGVKVWIFRGEVLSAKQARPAKQEQPVKAKKTIGGEL